MADIEFPKILIFDGRTTSIHVGTASSLGFTGRDFTVEAWVRLDAGDPMGERVVLGTDQTGNNSGLHLVIRDRRPYMGFYANDMAGVTELAPDVWYHVAWRYTQATQEQAIFVNGVLDSNTTGHAPFQGAGDVFIGRWAARYYFKGAIAEVRVWDHSRSDNEIKGQMQRRLQGTESGLTAYWKLEDGGDDLAADSTQHMNHGTLEGEPNWVQEAPSAAFGGSLSLDGRDDLVTIDNFRWPDDGPVTVEFWARVTESDLKERNSVLFTVGGIDRHADRFQAHVPWGNKVLYWDYGNIQANGRVSVDFSPYLGKWTHVVLVSGGRAGNFMGIFLNGELVAKTAQSNAPESRLRGLFIGKQPNHMYHKGKVTDFRIWRRVRSTEEIQADMRRQLDGTEPDLVGYWQLATNAEDSLAPHTGTFVAPGTWDELDAPIQPVIISPIKPVPTTTFDGAKSHITIPYADHLNISQVVTVEAWVRPTGQSPDSYRHPVVSQHGAATGWELRCGNSGAQFMVTVNRVHYYATLNKEVDLNQWHHLAGVFDGKTIYLFVNGVLKASTSLVGSITPYLSELNIGRNSRWPERKYSGQVAEVRVWSKARSANEIQSTLFRRLGGKESGLVGYWKLDEGQGDSAADSSDFHNTGSLLNVAWTPAEMPLAIAMDETGVEVDLEAQVRNLINERDQLRNRLAQVHSALAQAQSEVVVLKKMIAASNQEKDLLKLQLKKQEKDHLDEIKDIEALFNKEREQLLEKDLEVSLAGLIEKTEIEIKKAREVLLEKGSRYNLGRVSMELKMLPGADGTSMKFPEPGDISDVGQLSKVELNFTARETATEAPVVKNTVPDVTGYTELLARRKLAEAGFGMEAITQTVQAKGMEDRVVNQFPKAGKEGPSGTKVTVFIGKLSS